MKRYNPAEIEPKWQQIWEEQATYQAAFDPQREKLYVSGMFPYPSGAGMHAGHAFSYSIVDTLARFYRAHGRNVLNPMGWDTFGLPAENYAIKTGQAPAVITKVNIDNFKRQFKKMGVSIDWSREINTSDPEYYRWTQWVFTKFYERGLAYQKSSLQWWCPVDKTVLANEQVESGRCWRCGSEVVKKSMKQWFFKITDYAETLLAELDDIDWPDKIKNAQRNWIGRSLGAEIDFQIKGYNDNVTVFTTRPDTLFGATFLVLAPEHPLVTQITTKDQSEAVSAYVQSAIKRSEIERQNVSREKTGVFTGRYAINPATGEAVPIWVADYVLYGYGTGAIMAVPAHDERDFEFAETFSLPIKQVIEPSETTGAPFGGEGKLINSDVFDGTESSEAREQITAWLEEQGIGKSKITYKMRDWLISRQRYWGAPIPIIHCPKHGATAVPEEQLPVILPDVDDYAPKGNGQSVLASVDEWVNTTCPVCGGPARRETDTMDGYACSSWYLLRYTDPHNRQAPWDKALANYWAPVDFYVGGDHAVAHLLYVRFWTHVFQDMGLIDFGEPVERLVFHGHVLASDGTKMSKSKGNVVDPLDIIDQGYGADALRTYLLFMGPLELDASWDTRGVGGVYRFLNRVFVLTQEFLESAHEKSLPGDDEVTRLRHRTAYKVTDDIHRLSFNTAIAALMEYVNELYKLKAGGFSPAWQDALSVLVQLIAPFAPHLAAELWQQLGATGMIDTTPWPDWDEKYLKDSYQTIIVQVNGKLRDRLQMPVAASESDVTERALRSSSVQRYLSGKPPQKIIFVTGKLINIVV